jgi:hypothetical protein
MKYMLLIYEDEAVYGTEKNGPAIQEIVGKHMAFNKELGSVRVAGAGLEATSAATTVRTSNGSKIVHDGPFAETKEQLGGYYLIDVPNREAAVEIAKKLPIYKDGCVEIRPVLGGG